MYVYIGIRRKTRKKRFAKFSPFSYAIAFLFFFSFFFSLYVYTYIHTHMYIYTRKRFIGKLPPSFTAVTSPSDISAYVVGEPRFGREQT